MLKSFSRRYARDCKMLDLRSAFGQHKYRSIFFRRRWAHPDDSEDVETSFCQSLSGPRPTKTSPARTCILMSYQFQSANTMA